MEWPSIFVADAKAKGKGMVWGCVPEQGGRCPNCGSGNGIMRAVYVKPDGRALHYIKEIDSMVRGELEAQPCPVCAARDNKLSRVLALNCGLSGNDLDIRIDEFLPLVGKEAAHAAALKIMAALPRSVGWYTFWGGYGRGKTLLLKALVNQVRLTNVQAVYTTLADMVIGVRNKFGETPGSVELAINEWRGVLCLFVDEVDKVKLTDWTQETVFRLLDARYNARFETLTVLAMNPEPRKLSDELGYLASRMSAGKIIEVGGDDLRPIED